MDETDRRGAREAAPGHRVEAEPPALASVGGRREALPARPVWKERIEHPGRIARLLQSLAGRRARGAALTEEGRRVEGVACALDVPGERLGWRFDGPVPAAPYVLEVYGYSAVLRFEVRRHEARGGLVLIPYPAALTRVRQRWLRRVAAHAGCAVSFSHPLWPQVTVRRELVDISYEGLSFLTEPGEDLLHPGMRLPMVEVSLAGREPVFLTAEVRNVSRTPRGRHCGLWLKPLTEAQGRAWRELVEAQLYPHTRVEGDWDEETWRLLERAGAFLKGSREPARCEARRAAYEEAQGKLQGRPWLGYRVVRPTEDGVEATLSVVKPYARSWLAHQLARQVPVVGLGGRRRSAREALRDVYLRGYEPAQLDPDARWLFAYCDASERWMRPTQFEFARWYAHTGQTYLLDFRLMEAEVARPWPVPEGVEVGEPTAEERERFFARLRETRPEAFREALDLVPERFGLEETRALWGAAGLVRERALRVARCGGRAVAFAVLEVAQRGLNVSNVLDGVRLVPLTEDGAPEAQEAMRALLGAAADWYRARSRETFLHYVEAACVEYCERAALADLGGGKLWIISAALLPEFVEHLSALTTSRGDA